VADSQLKVIATYQGAQLEAGLARSTSQVSQAAQNIEGRFLKLGGTLKDFRREQVAQGRQVQFLAGELSSLIPGVDAASGSLRGLLSILVEGAAGGLSFGLAFEAIKFTVGLVNSAIREQGERVRNLAAISRDSAEIIASAWQRVWDAQKKPTEGQKEYEAAIKASAPAIEELEKKVAKVKDAGPGTLSYLRSVFGDPASMRAWNNAYAEASEQLIKTRNAAVNAAAAAAAWVTEEQKRASALVGFGRQAEESEKRRHKAREILEAAVRTDAEASDKRRAEFQRGLEDAGIRAKKILEDEAKLLREIEAKVITSQAPPMRESTAAELTRGDAGAGHEAQAKRIEKEMAAAKAQAAALAGTISGPLGNALSGMLLHGKGVFESLKGFFTSLAESFIQHVAEMIAQWIALKVVMATTGGGGLFGFMPGFASGSWEIPRDTVAYLHRGEMVVPAAPAESIRKGEAAMGAGSSTNINVTIHATDARSVERLFRENQGPLLRSLRDAAGNRRG